MCILLSHHFISEKGKQERYIKDNDEMVQYELMLALDGASVTY